MTRYVSRADWGARRPKYRYTADMSRTSTGHWNGPQVTVGGKTTWDHAHCAGLVRGIQNFHMDGQGWSDIAYNFVICPHNYIFEGRGINVINGANGTNEGNRTAHAVMWLSGENNPFTDGEKEAFRFCVTYVSDRSNAPDGRAIGHRDHKSTACPGDERYQWIHLGMPLPAPPPKEEEEVIAQFTRDINDAYKAFLSRSPSVKELRGWLNEAIKRGNTDEIVKWIANSEESLKADGQTSDL